MTIDVTRSVAELALDMPHAYRIFDRAGIDFCCGGKRSLTEACARAGVALEPLVRSLEAGAAAGGAPAIDWRRKSASELVAHILATHHVFTREELARADRLLAKVAGVHGARHPELHRMRAVFDPLRDELLLHMRKEENILFPYILALDEARSRGLHAAPPPFRTVENPVRMMNAEHESAGEMLRALRAASGEYTLPDDACGSFRALYTALAALEADLHQHIHLENNLLFPRAVELERS